MQTFGDYLAHADVLFRRNKTASNLFPLQSRNTLVLVKSVSDSQETDWFSTVELKKKKIKKQGV